jgi:hypothetical protein
MHRLLTFGPLLSNEINLIRVVLVETGLTLIVDTARWQMSMTYVTHVSITEYQR